MATTTEDTKNSGALPQRTVLLDIPARLQWENDQGFCGETAIQSFGLYYGAWISQKLVRDINQGEYLMRKVSADDPRNSTRTLSVLHFTYDEWSWEKSPQPQFRDYCCWMKKSIIRGHPVIFAVYLLYFHGNDYDHLMPAVGVRFQDEDIYNSDDALIYYNLFHDKRIERKMNEKDLAGTRKTCRKHCGEGGCIPLNVDYGIAVTGIVDKDHVTLPVRLAVSAWNEPNPHPAYNEQPIEMDGIVTVRDLTVGNSYVLLRYSSYEHVPTKGSVEDFLASPVDEKHEFVPTEVTYTYVDPKKIPSTGSVYYRCVPRLEQ